MLTAHRERGVAKATTTTRVKQTHTQNMLKYATFEIFSTCVHHTKEIPQRDKRKKAFI